MPLQPADRPLFHRLFRTQAAQMKYIAVVALMLNHRLRSNALVFTEFQWGFSTWTNGWLIVQVAPADRHTRFRTYSRIPD
jgi:hypothetical protein